MIQLAILQRRKSETRSFPEQISISRLSYLQFTLPLCLEKEFWQFLYYVPGPEHKLVNPDIFRQKCNLTMCIFSYFAFGNLLVFMQYLFWILRETHTSLPFAEYSTLHCSNPLMNTTSCAINQLASNCTDISVCHREGGLSYAVISLATVWIGLALYNFRKR